MWVPSGPYLRRNKLRGLLRLRGLEHDRRRVDVVTVAVRYFELDAIVPIRVYIGISVAVQDLVPSALRPLRRLLSLAILGAVC